MTPDPYRAASGAPPSAPAGTEPAVPAGSVERRFLLRLPVRLAVTRAERAEPLGTTRDLTLAGMFLETSVRLEPGDVLALALQVPGEEAPVVVEATVARVAPDGAGLRFNGVAEPHRKRLRRVLAAATDALSTRDTAELLHTRSRITRTEVTRPAEVRALLQGLRDERSPLRVLPAASPTVLDARLQRVEDSKVELECAAGRALAPGDELWVLCAVRVVNYSFRARVAEVTSSRLILDLPERVVHSERRSAEREVVDDAHLLLPLPWAPGEAARWPVLDLSEGGLAFRVDPGRWSLLPGASLEGVRLVRGGVETPLVGATVRNVRRVEPDVGPAWLRVGISHGVARRDLAVSREAVAAPRGVVGRVVQGARAARAWLELQWHRRTLARAQAPEDDARLPEVVHFRSANGLPLVGLLQQSPPATNSGRVPLVIVAPGFAGRKEQMSYLASILVETFRARGEPIRVLRFDGSNNLGESGRDPTPDAEAHPALHYTIGGAVDDLRGALDWARSDPRLAPEWVAVVSVSFSSCAVMRWLAEDAPPEVKLWVSYMGAADARDAVRRVSGHYDVFAAAESGRPLGRVAMLGCVVDAAWFWADVVRSRTGTLAHARRYLAAISADVIWLAGQHDAFMDLDRVRDILSVHAPGSRRLVEVDSGHVPRTGDEAIRQFSLVAREVWKSVHGTAIEARAPSLGELEARRRWEWARTRKSRLEDPTAFWRGYLLAGGYDVMRWLPSYAELIEDQVARVRPRGRRMLDAGAGTGNLALALARAGAAEVVAVDLVPEALEVAREKTAGLPVRVVAGDLDGGPVTALRRWRSGSIARVSELVGRLPGLPEAVARRLDEVDDPALLAVLRGAAGDLALLPGAARLDPDDIPWLEDLRDLARVVDQPGAQRPTLRRFPTEVLDGPAGLPFPAASFDGAVASLVLSYLDHPEDLLAELHRVVVPGGTVVVSSMRRDADTSSLFLELVDRLEQSPPERVGGEAQRQQLLAAARHFHGQGAALFRLEEEGRFRFYEPGELVTMLLAAGFEDPRPTPAFGDPPQAVVVECRRP